MIAALYDNLLLTMAKTGKKQVNIALTELEKNKEVMDLANAIKLYDRHLISKDKKSRIMDLDARMDFRLRELLSEVQLREADIKIDIFSQILSILKETNIHK